jgi:hypothetical protein
MNKINVLAALTFLTIATVASAYNVRVTNNTMYSYRIHIYTTDLIKTKYTMDVGANKSNSVNTAGYCISYIEVENTYTGETPREFTTPGTGCGSWSINIFQSGNTWNFTVR